MSDSVSASDHSSLASSHPVSDLARLVLPVITATLLVLLLWFYTSLSQRFPFDLAWDMDVTAVHDALLVNSGQFPLHLDHPKFAMHLISAWALQLGSWLQLVSVANLADLAQSPSPLLCIAELTLFLRAVEAGVIWLSLLLVTGLFYLLFPGRAGLHLAALMLLSLQIGVLYCCTVMRTEAYSIFLLLLGLFVFCFLVKRKSSQTETLAWIFAGLGFGLAVLTKLQAIMAGPFFLAFCGYVYHAENQHFQEPQAEPGAPKPWFLPLAGLSLLMLVALACAAWMQASLPGQAPALLPVAAYQSGELSLGQLMGHLKLQFVWLLLFSSLPVSVLILRSLKSRQSVYPSVYQRLLAFYPLFWCGLALAFILPGFSFVGRTNALSQGWQFLLQMAQTCFWTDTQASSTVEAGALLKTLSFALITNKNYLLLALAVLVVAAYQYYRLRLERSSLAKGFLPAGLLFITGTGVLLLGSRAILRDTIWFEFLGLLSVLILLNQSWGSLQLRSLKALLMLCLGLPILSSFYAIPVALDQIYLYFAPFKSSEYSPLINAWYARPGMEYPRIMLAAYADNMPDVVSPREVLRRAVEQGRLVKALQGMADLPFLNLHLPVRAMGLASPGFPVWARNGVWARFLELEPALRGSILVNPLVINAQPGAKQWLAMNDRAPVAERRLRASGGSYLSLLPNSDLRVLFCLSRPDAIALFGEVSPVWQTAAKIKTADQTEDYYAFLLDQDVDQSILETITGYSEFDRNWLAGLKYPPFFLIHHGNDWGPIYPAWSNMEALLETAQQ